MCEGVERELPMVGTNATVTHAPKGQGTNWGGGGGGIRSGDHSENQQVITVMITVMTIY